MFKFRQSAALSFRQLLKMMLKTVLLVISVNTEMSFHGYQIRNYLLGKSPIRIGKYVNP